MSSPPPFFFAQPNQYKKAYVITVSYDGRSAYIVGLANFTPVSSNKVMFVIDMEGFNNIVATTNTNPQVTLQDFDIVLMQPVGTQYNVTFTNGESGIYTSQTHYVYVTITFNSPGTVNFYFSY